MQDFKILYRGGATQTVTADQHQPQGTDWVVFYDQGGEIVLRVPSKDVLSIARADVPDRVTPGPLIA